MTLALVLVAVLLLVSGVVLRRFQITPKIGSTLIVVSVFYGAAAVVVPRIAGGEPERNLSPEVTIVQPTPGATVAAGEPVVVDVELVNAKIATSAHDTKNGHLHVYVDGRLENMPYTTKTRVMLSPGRHEIKVEYVDWQHVSYFPRVQESVTVEARG